MVMKLFRSTNIDIIDESRSFLNFMLRSEKVNKNSSDETANVNALRRYRTYFKILSLEFMNLLQSTLQL